ncbi:TPA: 3-deoxy-D-manno-octulosonate 8-phosphate phosphatase [Corynebacterium striatum]|nr:3-deoxy-D-manno-octulosonate 8-phosphate phosphatase [Corynebacterium striatum]HAT1174910.1 3-deoxy-D-manno-octulosonate 8-phosphate phosphatase [Corynebacterium striatum]HAT1200188.1 3-deoxy-D-manno-octulosonate 8-phosphate phosphatase [Corynebacterium striatum]HAT1202937.1 3-deoxy-D-manno-octulosonate 8-phosphate phosphatase [Corynebacterium striatum]HAT1205703.1 3-deoxy-D-manno-octulosonate 8-phosphate phosphatase [Corynebacterium striatum]
MVKANKSLQARQAVRQHFEEEQQKLRDRKKKLNSMLSLLDQRDALDLKIGKSARELVDLGEKKSTVRGLIGVSAKEFSDLLSLGSDDSKNDNASADEKTNGAELSSNEASSAESDG